MVLARRGRRARRRAHCARAGASRTGRSKWRLIGFNHAHTHDTPVTHSRHGYRRIRALSPCSGRNLQYTTHGGEYLGVLACTNARTHLRKQGTHSRFLYLPSLCRRPAAGRLCQTQQITANALVCCTHAHTHVRTHARTHTHTHTHTHARAIYGTQETNIRNEYSNKCMNIRFRAVVCVLPRR